jgi:hypothetical protein
MAIQLTQLPMRKNNEIETRPMYVEEWLDSLPYIDFVTTSQLMHESLKATNKVQMKPGQRMELVTLYNRPYQYYVDSQVRTGAQHTMQTIATLTSQLDRMKYIAMDMALACRLAMNDTLNHKTLWGQNKSPMEASLMEMHYLSHVLIFSYLEYAPIPKNIWRELYVVYDFANGMDKHRSQITLVNSNNKKTMTTIESTFKRILLASLSDPHHLPFGAIWEIYEQLEDWMQYTQLESFHEVNNPKGMFVVNLRSDARPVPYNKFNIQKASANHRLLDANSLLSIVKEQRNSLESDRASNNDLVLSPYHAKSLLDTMLDSWGMPALRRNKREPDSGKMNISCGINSIYFHLNNQIEFDMPQQIMGESSNVAEITNIPQHPETVTPHYELEEYQRVDASNCGLAISHKGKPSASIRVGDLLGLHSLSDKNQIRVGIIRWLMVQQNNYRIGIKIIGEHVSAAAIRAIEGNGIDCEYRRAALANDSASGGNVSLIANKGLYNPERTMELAQGNDNQQITANQLIESTVNIEQFNYKRS